MQEWFVEYNWRVEMNKKKVGSFDSDEDREELLEWALNGE